MNDTPPSRVRAAPDDDRIEALHGQPFPLRDLGVAFWGSASFSCSRRMEPIERSGLSSRSLRCRVAGAPPSRAVLPAPSPTCRFASNKEKAKFGGKFTAGFAKYGRRFRILANSVNLR